MTILESLEQRAGDDASARFTITGTDDCSYVREYGVLVFAASKRACFGFVGEAMGRDVPEGRR